ncbi:MAG: hypothetical protein MI755_17055 [Sphingomonadales bacterium]|nr:hypothetical protein [Sphingomonadales bacterium]
MRVLFHSAVCFVICVVMLAVGGEAEAKKKKPAKTVEIPKCVQNLGAVAVQEPQNQWWYRYNLGNPEALIKLIVQRSGCFMLVDRGRGLEMRQTERALGDSDELQRGSNLGKGQLKAADYFIIPDIVAQDEDAGGSAVGGAVGGLIGGRVGGLLGGVKTKRLEAHTLLTLTNTRTGVQEIIAEGTASQKDFSFGAGGGIFAGVGVGLVGGGYEDTEIGKVITAAYVDAYTEMVTQLGGMSANAAASAPIPAHEMVEKARMYQGPSEEAGVVRMLRAGALVYPTGQKEDIFWEVEDKNGNRGWVSSEYLEQAK